MAWDKNLLLERIGGIDLETYADMVEILGECPINGRSIDFQSLKREQLKIYKQREYTIEDKARLTELASLLETEVANLIGPDKMVEPICTMHDNDIINSSRRYFETLDANYASIAEEFFNNQERINFTHPGCSKNFVELNKKYGECFTFESLDEFYVSIRRKNNLSDLFEFNYQVSRGIQSLALKGVEHPRHYKVLDRLDPNYDKFLMLDYLSKEQIFKEQLISITARKNCCKALRNFEDGMLSIKLMEYLIEKEEWLDLITEDELKSYLGKDYIIPYINGNPSEKLSDTISFLVANTIYREYPEGRKIINDVNTSLLDPFLKLKGYGISTETEENVGNLKLYIKSLN